MQDPKVIEYAIQKNFNDILSKLISAVDDSDDDDDNNTKLINQNLLPTTNYNIDVEQLSLPENLREQTLFRPPAADSREQADKPGSVLDSNLSGADIANYLNATYSSLLASEQL